MKKIILAASIALGASTVVAPIQFGQTQQAQASSKGLAEAKQLKKSGQLSLNGIKPLQSKYSAAVKKFGKPVSKTYKKSDWGDYTLRATFKNGNFIEVSVASKKSNPNNAYISTIGKKLTNKLTYGELKKVYKASERNDNYNSSSKKLETSVYGGGIDDGTAVEYRSAKNAGKKFKDSTVLQYVIVTMMEF